MKKNDLYELSFEMKKQLQHRILKIVLFCLFVFLIITLILRFVFFPIVVKTVSMEPTVSSGSFVFVSRLYKSPKRGNLVVIRDDNELSFVNSIVDDAVSFFTGQQYFPFAKLKNSSSSLKLRRIVGIPGDTIYMSDYVLYIKPKGELYFLTEFERMTKLYNISIVMSDSNWDFTLGSVGKFDEITLGPDEYFLLGDNRNSALDSRLWGAVNTSDIVGEAIFQYFPFNSLKLF